MLKITILCYHNSMDKIVFKISNNLLSVSIITKDTPKLDLNNTNIIDTKEIVFSKDYILDNLELVSSFLNVIIIKRNINKASIKNEEIVSLILDILNFIPSIKELYLRENEQISYDIFLKLLDNKYLNKLEVYDIPKYLLERLDVNKHLEIKVRSEILFISSFMKSNKLNTYSDIFYKKNIIIDNAFDKNDLNDFITFMSINKYLKIINFIKFDSKTFNLIMNILLQKNKEDIKIVFEEKTCDLTQVLKEVNEFKHYHEKVLKSSNLVFKINYSDEYKKKNFFKQVNLNFIKISLIAIIIVVASMMGINAYRNYIDEQNYLDIESDLRKIMHTNVTNNSEDEFNYIEPEEGDTTTTTTTTTVYDIAYEKVFPTLQSINKDTVAWLTVNNTRIDYPVVQTTNNEYYLKKDFYRNGNRHGWIFMDYRNNPEELDLNTIVYGHNLANQSMFGTLRYALNSSWYKKTSNQIITFNTPYANMKWQIFSIYKVPVTTDYLLTTFPDDNAYAEFIKLISERSIYNFNQTINADDKIITLSTCTNGNDNRLVIHAKLIKEG